MTRFAKFASVALVAASLAPFAAQARSGDLGTAGQSSFSAQPAQGAFVPGRGAENAHVASLTNSNNGTGTIINSYPDGRPVSANA